jgi:hypothetical protein
LFQKNSEKQDALGIRSTDSRECTPCLKQGKIGRKIDKKEAEETEEDGRSVCLSVSFSFSICFRNFKKIRKSWENEAPIQANVSKHSCLK